MVREVKYNFVFDWVEYIIFREELIEFIIYRLVKFGGDVIYIIFEELKKDFVEGKFYLFDFKNVVVEYFIEFFKLVREYFEKYFEFFELMREIKIIW